MSRGRLLGVEAGGTKHMAGFIASFGFSGFLFLFVFCFCK